MNLATNPITAPVEVVRASVEDFLAELDQRPDTALAPRFAAARTHLLEGGGKLVRPTIVWLLGRSLGVEEARLRPYALAVELLHAASLLHDDVVDRADTRRGRPTANALHDNSLPVLAGDSLLSEVMVRIAELGDLAAIRRIARTVQDLVAGEAVQYELRGRLHGEIDRCVTVADLKTGSLLALCTWLPAHLAGLPPELAERFAQIGRVTGIAFQLIDDILDFQPEGSGKPALIDWQDGCTNSMTATLVDLYPESAPDLRALLAERGASSERAHAVLHRWFPTPRLATAAERVRAHARHFSDRAEIDARLVPDNPYGRTFVLLQRALLERRG